MLIQSKLRILKLAAARGDIVNEVPCPDIVAVGDRGRQPLQSDILLLQLLALPAVPEPSIYAAFLGILALGLVACRRRKQG